MAPIEQRIANIPDELKQVQQWVNWRYETDDKGKETKRPLSPHTGEVANAHEPWNQSSFDHVLNNAVNHSVGIGFVLTEADPYVVIDLDSPVGKVEPTEFDRIYDNGNKLIIDADSYTELSPSGNGVHIWMRANVPPNGVRSSADCIELYSTARFITVTGEAFGDLKPIADRTNVARYVHSALDRSVTPLGEIVSKPCNKTPDEIFAEIGGWSNAETFWKLGNTPFNQPGVDQSATDLGLMNFLVQATRNVEKALECFDATPRANRDKWRNREDYRSRTVRRAFDKVNNVPLVPFPERMKAALLEQSGLKSVGTTPDAKPQSKTLKLADMMDVARTNSDTQFTTERLTPVGEVTMLSANGGVGKTMLALQWAMSIASGQQFFGIDVQQSPVLFVSAEDRAAPSAKRLAAIANQMHLTIRNEYTQRAYENFNFWEVTGEPLWTESRNESKGVPTLLMTELKRRIVASGARQVFIDNASSVFCGNHNDNVQVTAFLTALRIMAEECGCNVVLLAHVSAESANGMTRKTYYGSTAWHNAVRSRIFMELIPPKDGVPEHIRIAHEKSNYGPLASPFKARRNENGVLLPVTENQIQYIENENESRIKEQLFIDVCDAASKGHAINAAAQGQSTFYHNLCAHYPERYKRDDKATERMVRALLDRLEIDGRILKRSGKTDKGAAKQEWVPHPQYGIAATQAGQGSPQSPNSPQLQN